MKSIAKNRKAFFDYYIEEKYEAGIALRGSEVKSLRLGHGSLADGCYAVVREGQAFIINFTIPALKQAAHFGHPERRERRLLLKRKEIDELDRATRQKGYTLVPLEVYFSDNGIVKIEIALAKGKAYHDKREVTKEKEAKREVERAVRR